MDPPQEPLLVLTTSNIRERSPSTIPSPQYERHIPFLSHPRRSLPEDPIYSLPPPDRAARFVFKSEEGTADDSASFPGSDVQDEAPQRLSTPGYDASILPPRIYFVDCPIGFVPPFCYDHLERDPLVKGVPRNYRAWGRTGRPKLEVEGLERVDAKSDFLAMGLTYPHDSASEGEGDEKEKEKKRKRKKKLTAKAQMVPIERPRRNVRKIVEALPQPSPPPARSTVKKPAQDPSPAAEKGKEKGKEKEKEKDREKEKERAREREREQEKEREREREKAKKVEEKAVPIPAPRIEAKVPPKIELVDEDAVGEMDIDAVGETDSEAELEQLSVPTPPPPAPAPAPLPAPALASVVEKMPPKERQFHKRKQPTEGTDYS